MSLPVYLRDGYSPRYRFLAERAWAANAAVQQRVSGVRELVLAKAGSEGTSGKAVIDRCLDRARTAVVGSGTGRFASVLHR